MLAARDFYKLPHADLLVICDDLNLPTGKVRVRAKGTSGGQKGLEDILRRLGEELVPNIDQGIIELVRNAYDADATKCIVTLSNVRHPGGRIRIEDDAICINNGITA